MIVRTVPEPATRHPRLAAMSIIRHPFTLAAVALLAVACSTPGASPSSAPPSVGPSASPDASPSGSPTNGEIGHPTGATDVILRYDDVGGFVMPAFLASRTPYFTLYGDGTIVFQRLTEDPPKELPNGAFAGEPLRIARMSEPQIQELLRYALTEGGLAIARENYANDMVADASTAVFDIDAGGVKKSVSVYALGMDADPAGRDALARAAFARLAERLRDIDDGGSIPTDLYQPAAYRGVLFEAGPVQGVAPIAWPWSDLAPADFVVPAGDDAFQFPSHTLSPAQVEALGIPGDVAPGGVQNLFVSGPDKKLYTLAVRPLLPDETS